jgi:hypothetical protein
VLAAKKKGGRRGPPVHDKALPPALYGAAFDPDEAMARRDGSPARQSCGYMSRRVALSPRVSGRKLQLASLDPAFCSAATHQRARIAIVIQPDCVAKFVRSHGRRALAVPQIVAQ